MLLFDGPLTFREYMAHEELPLAIVFREVLTFLAGREDAVLFGAQAINAYVEPARMTQDVDVMSTDGERLAADLRQHLADRFHIAVRVRDVAEHRSFRVYQLMKPKNRHLIDVRGVDHLPAWEPIGGVHVLAPLELAVMKVTSLTSRRNKPKGGTDLVDLQRLLLARPDLRPVGGPVAERLREIGASEDVVAMWTDVASRPLEPDDDDEDW